MMWTVNRPQIEVIPTLFLGSGGRGTMAIHYCREIVLKELFNDDPEKLKRDNKMLFLAVDSAKQLLEDTGKKYDFQAIEIAADADILKKALKNSNFPNTGESVAAVMSHLPPGRNYQQMLTLLVDSRHGMQTCPPMGRINLLCSWSRVYNELKGIIEGSWKDIKDNTFQVFVISSLYGGTGAGIHIDIAAMIRFIFREIQLNEPNIYGIFILPDVIGAPNRLLRANAYTCLKELDHFLSGNPYTIRLANGKDLTIENKGLDCIFNRVFLVNDRNKFKGEPAVRLSGPEEVCRMIGELLFYWSCTTLGKNISARLVDAPLEAVKKWAPKYAPEKRITAYSTFGLATASIPYDSIKHNLAVSLAIKIMEELAEEKEEKRVIEAYLSKDLFRETNINDESIREQLDLRIPEFAKYNSFEEFREDKDEGLEEAFQDIKRQITRNKIDEERLLQVKRDIEQQFYEKVKEIKDELLKEAGPGSATKVLREIKDHINNALSRTRISMYSDGEKNISIALNKLEEVISGRKGSLLGWLFGPDKTELERTFSRLKGTIKKRNESTLAEIKRDIFWQCLDRLNDVEKELEVEKKKFQKITQILRTKTKSYYESTVYFSPVSEDTIRRFIEGFEFPKGYRHEELADEIRKNGLYISDENNKAKSIPVSDFDDYTEKVAEAMFAFTKEKVEEISKDYLYKSFSESGFFNSIDNYFKTLEELDRRSSPYLEYMDGEGFEPTHKEGFIIYPDNKNEWERTRYTFSLDRRLDIVGDTDISPFSITMIQFHYGLPLYSIDEIEFWDEAYRNFTEDEDRPLHKFREDMKDPVIMSMRIKIDLKKNEIEQLYNWAIDVSKKGIYPVLLKDNDIWILPPCNNYDADSPFYDIYKRLYLDPKNIEEMLKDAPPTLKKELEIQLMNLINQKELFKSCIYDALQKDNISKVLQEIANKKVSNEVIQVDSQGKIHINPDSKYFPQTGEFLRIRFLKRRQEVKVKEGLTYNKILEVLNSKPPVLSHLIIRCDKALQFIKNSGRIKECPAPDFINEKLF